MNKLIIQLEISPVMIIIVIAIIFLICLSFFYIGSLKDRLNKRSREVVNLNSEIQTIQNNNVELQEYDRMVSLAERALTLYKSVELECLTLREENFKVQDLNKKLTEKNKKFYSEFENQKEVQLKDYLMFNFEEEARLYATLIENILNDKRL